MKETRITLHIPTEQYGFVGIECEGSSATETADLYREYAQAFQPTAGLPERDFNAFIDRMLLGQDGNHIEQYEAMSDKQRDNVQCIKRGLKRLKAKEE